MFTEREALERVPTFSEQHRRAARRDVDASTPVVCDSCGRVVDEPLRARHRGCQPPPLPPIAERILADLRARRDQRKVQR
jgi:hypothetical protein